MSGNCRNSAIRLVRPWIFKVSCRMPLFSMLSTGLGEDVSLRSAPAISPQPMTVIAMSRRPQAFNPTVIAPPKLVAQ